MKKYKVKLIKKYKFELDGTSKRDIAEQVEYILTKPEILDLPDVRKSQNLIIKKIYREKRFRHEKNS